MKAIWCNLGFSLALVLSPPSSIGRDPLTNVVQNGGFESFSPNPFNLPGWVLVDVPALLTGWRNAPEGRNYAYVGTIAQEIPTIPNQRYLLSFTAAADLYIQPTASIAVGWDGQTAVTLTTQPQTYDPLSNRYEQIVWERFSVPLTARDASSGLLLASIDDGRFLLDDVRLVPFAGSAPIPLVRVVNEVRVPPLLYDPQATSHFVIAPDGVKAAVVLDASASTDPDGDSLNYVWGFFDEGQLRPLPCLQGASSATVICTLFVGDLERQHLGLNLCDSTSLCSMLRFTVYVLAPADVVRFLVEDVNEVETQYQVRLRSKRALLNALNRAEQSFESGDASRAIRFLDDFRQLIHNQRRSLGDELTQAFLDLSEAVIRAVE